MPCRKRRRGNPGGKRGPYKVKKENRRYGNKKTTTPDGYNDYLRMYMRDKRRLKL